tara:strand:+ start:771 stop:1043 length:273 start_codon:yes stop_codon:yes gene_type:complete
MKDLSKYLIEEIKQEQYLKDLHAIKVVDMNDWFKYSGKQEVRCKRYKYNDTNYSKFVIAPTHYVPPLNYRSIMKANNMTKYKLKNNRKVW